MKRSSKGKLEHDKLSVCQKEFVYFRVAKSGGSSTHECVGRVFQGLNYSSASGNLSRIDSGDPIPAHFPTCLIIEVVGVPGLANVYKDSIPREP